jgi:hypothetical protein
MGASFYHRKKPKIKSNLAGQLFNISFYVVIFCSISFAAGFIMRKDSQIYQLKKT